MIRYRYYDSDGVANITRDEIIEHYWHIWKQNMVKKYGKNDANITEDNCVSDWCVMHAAWIVDDHQTER